MGDPWPSDLPGVLALPSGRRVLGRGLCSAPPEPPPEFGVHLLGRRPADAGREQQRVRWPDFGLPADDRELRRALTEAWDRAGGERVEMVAPAAPARRWPAWPCWTASLPLRP